MVDISFKELNNKSRKGIYIYIKDKTKSRYYKFDERKGLDFYTNYFYSNKKDRINYKKYEQKYLQSQKVPIKDKSKYTQNDISKGISTIKIKDVHNINSNQLNKKIKELFSKVVKDKEILNLVIQESNIEKLKKRLSYRINIYSEEGKFMGDYIVSDFKTPNQIVNGIKQYTTKGTKYENGYLNGLDQAGYKSNNSLNDGYVGRIELEVTFIKRR